MFDTLTYANKLKAAGVPEQQANVHAETLVAIVSENLATKEDVSNAKTALEGKIANLKTELKQDIKDVRSELTVVSKELVALGERAVTKEDLAELKVDLIKWVVGVMLAVATAQTALVFGIVKLFAS